MDPLGCLVMGVFVITPVLWVINWAYEQFAEETARKLEREREERECEEWDGKHRKDFEELKELERRYQSLSPKTDFKEWEKAYSKFTTAQEKLYTSHPRHPRHRNN